MVSERRIVARAPVTPLRFYKALHDMADSRCGRGYGSYMVLPSVIETGLSVATGGSGAWFGGKVLGPSADALGKQLQVYLAGRIAKIFDRSEELAKERGVEPAPIAPGLLTRMVIDASFSEESEDLTEWWANLFLDASEAQSNRHAVYAEVMAVLGPREVACLADLMLESPRLKSVRPDLGFHEENLQGFLNEIMDKPCKDLAGAEVLIEKIDKWRGAWPIRSTSWALSLEQAESQAITGFGRSEWFWNNAESLGILQRAGVIESLRLDGPILLGIRTWVKAVAVTPLGVGFYAACNGHEVER